MKPHGMHRQTIVLPQPSIQNRVTAPVQQAPEYDPAQYEPRPVAVERWRRGELFTNPALRIAQEMPADPIWVEPRQIHIRSGNQNPDEQGVSQTGVAVSITPNTIKDTTGDGIGFFKWIRAPASAASSGSRTTTTAATQASFLERTLSISKETYGKAKAVIINNPRTSLGVMVGIGGAVGAFLWLNYGETFGIKNKYIATVIALLLLYRYRKQIKRYINKKFKVKG